jgi:1,2-diacylglycerol 3-beta-glucosyltransferase
MNSAVWSVVAVVLIALSVPFVISTAYLAYLSIFSGRLQASAPDQSTTFDILVPAHNESAGIGKTVTSLLAMEYPSAMYRILVIADNCTDDTAERAQAAGAMVLERHNHQLRGKGYALAHGYAASLGEGFAQAIVVVDADTSVSTNLLSAFSARFKAGAEAVQAEHGVRNADDSWRTRLMVIAYALYHTLRSNARERLNLSCGLRGNGMGFSAALLRRVPPRAFSVVEDIEYGVTLGLAGTRVVYVHEAEVRGDMPVSSEASAPQRARWEGGRTELIRQHVGPLWRAARGPGRGIPLDLAADLLVPPLTTIVLWVTVGVVITALLVARGLVPVVTVVPWAAAFVALVLYVVRGAMLAPKGLRTLADLLWAPAFAIWKVTLLLRPNRNKGEWVRTTRSDEI